jgi:hypothetical protein
MLKELPPPLRRRAQGAVATAAWRAKCNVLPRGRRRAQGAVAAAWRAKRNVLPRGVDVLKELSPPLLGEPSATCCRGASTCSRSCRHRCLASQAQHVAAEALTCSRSCRHRCLASQAQRVAAEATTCSRSCRHRCLARLTSLRGHGQSLSSASCRGSDALPSPRHTPFKWMELSRDGI